MTILFFWFENFHKCEKKYEKEIFDRFLFYFISLDLQKIENHVGTFPYWFWFGDKGLNVYIKVPRTCHHLIKDPFSFFMGGCKVGWFTFCITIQFFAKWHAFTYY